MNVFRLLLDVFLHQLKNVVKIFIGFPLVTPSLTSATLDIDDVMLANKWLGKKDYWYRKDEVVEFNSQFALWNGSKYAFSFMGGRVALSAIIYALNLQPGDEVIVPGYTCVVVPNAFHFCGIETIYSDIELDTYGLDASSIEEKITAKTKAILIHHLYGLVCRDYEVIVEIAKAHNLFVIEDCAQSTGAIFKGHKIGNLGDAAFYSTEQSKVLTTIQGGLATTNDDNIAAKLKEYYDQAPYPDVEWIDKQLHNVMLNYAQYKMPNRWWKGDMIKLKYWKKLLISTTREEEVGIKPKYYGRKMPAPIASLGLNQLKKIDKYNEMRRITAKRWDFWCEQNNYRKPVVIENSIPVFLRYPVLVEPQKKQNIRWAQRELHVSPGVWFAGKLHPVNIDNPNCPNADLAVERCINFPGVMYD